MTETETKKIIAEAATSILAGRTGLSVGTAEHAERRDRYLAAQRKAIEAVAAVAARKLAKLRDPDFRERVSPEMIAPVAAAIAEAIAETTLLQASLDTAVAEQLAAHGH